MLNFIRVVLIGFMVLTVAGCTTIKAKSGFSVKTVGYEFTCTHEPSQKVIDKELAKKILDALSASAGLSYQVNGTGVKKELDVNGQAIIKEFASQLMTEHTKTLVENCQTLIHNSKRPWWRPLK